MTLALYDWPRVTGEPAGTAVFRHKLSDFQVSESLRFKPSGEGAHHLLFIEKRNVNTDIVTHKLRKFAQVKPLDIGYAGKKDRFAIARQWFSVQLPLLTEIDWQDCNDDEIQVLDVIRHHKKLRIGAVKENHFRILLRDFAGQKEVLEQKLARLQRIGFPNYFGEQRFGHNGDNLARALDLLATNKRLKNRNLQGLLFSSVRSFLFNHLLSQRINNNLYEQLLEGDFVQLEGSESGFVIEDLGKEQPRFDAKDLHPTLPLVGGGRAQTQAKALEFESEQLAEYQWLIEQLTSRRLNSERRAIRVFPKNVYWQWHNTEKPQLELSFSLPKGAYATAFLRELMDLQQVRHDENIVK
ncbi:tRNA pseudouridine(13) synthase TruD [Kangiella sp. TOML190]|uniref:tRNA pseudouridine(13) synthase TruD n=1 Tax=Kangiella sp. TOML190 TaxID=2931351 RepID=UPI00203C6565|nr:tRNA pseudouridine(13) synthase TruD [Kangiella sp. TOML190]